MRGFVSDLRLAVRGLVRRPGFALIALVTLALGIGANTAIFSVVNGVLLQGLPGVHDTRGLVELSRNVNGSHFDMSYRVFNELRTQSETLDDLAAMTIAPLALSVADENPTVHMGICATGNFLKMLNLTPAAGRFFVPERSFYPDVSSVAVISYRLWERRFDLSPHVVGQSVRINGHPTEIIGVTPAGFSGPANGTQVEIFVPLGMPAPGLLSASSLDSPTSGVLELRGRLTSGVTLDEARSELGLIADRSNRQHEPNASVGNYIVRVEGWGGLPAIVRTPVTVFFAILLGVVGLVLTMACTNVSSMILSRGIERRREIATRLALGASRLRIVRLLLTESLVLFFAGGVAGAFLAHWVVELLVAFEPPFPPGFVIEFDLGVDRRVLLFSLSISLLSGLIFSLAPALHATHPGLIPGLKEDGGSPRRTRLRSVMVGCQMAATVTLLIVAGLFLRALNSVESIDSGWDVEGVHVVDLNLELRGYDRIRGREFYERLTRRLEKVPGVEVAAVAAKLPLGGRSSLGDINVSGVPAPHGRAGHRAFLNTASPGYFRAVGLTLVRGRDFQRSDDVDSQLVAVINQTMAQRFWPDGAAVGEQFWVGPPNEGTAIEVIGVVEDAKYRRITDEATNFYYLSFGQRYNSTMILHVRSEDRAELAMAEVRRLIRELDPALPILAARPLSEALELFFLPQRLAASVSGAMGLPGLILGAVGVYGITAFAVAQRRREVGVRIAIGARPGDIVRLMLRQGMVAPMIGLALGTSLALGVTRFLGGFLAGISPLDPLTFGGAIGGRAAIAALAILLPASSASRLDPSTTLRAE